MSIVKKKVGGGGGLVGEWVLRENPNSANKSNKWKYLRT